MNKYVYMPNNPNTQNLNVIKLEIMNLGKSPLV